jgi:VanZ family protein
LFKKIFSHIILPVFIGFLVYLFLHKPNLWLHQVFQKYGTLNFYENIKSNAIAIFLLHHLPDVLWMYSLSVFIKICIDVGTNKIVTAVVILFIAVISEAIQIFFPTQFTFDWIDVLLNVLVALLVIKYINFGHKKRA